MESTTACVCCICCKIFYSPEKMNNGDLVKYINFLLQSNTNTLQNIPVCESCSEKIRNAYDFKKSYMGNFHKNVMDFNEKTTHETFSICLICKDIIRKSSSISLAALTKESKFIINYLSKELNLETREESHICGSCQESVLNFHSITNLLSVFDENRVNKTRDNMCGESSNIISQMNINQEHFEDFNRSCGNLNVKDKIIHNEELEGDYHLKMECQEVDLTEPMWKNLHKSVDESDLFTCALCQYTTKRKDIFKQHMLDVHEILNCEICEYQTKEHNELSHDEDMKMFGCHLCNFRAKKKGNLQKHMLVHKSVHEIEMFKCETCEFQTKYKHIIKSHSLVHKDIMDALEVFKCEICGYKTKIKGNFKRHEIIHKSIFETKLFECDICVYKTKNSGHLKQHLLVHKNFDEIETFICHICNFKAKRRGNLKKHMLSHKNVDEIPTFDCEVCDFKTKYKHILKSHRLVHKNINDIEVLYKCEVCEYKGKRKDTLKRHMLTHKNIPKIE